MNYKTFSKQEFEDCKNQDTSRRLSDELQAAVAGELHRVILPAFERIIRALNAEGHCLLPFEVSVGDLAYRDEPAEINADSGWRAMW